jgi:hypothetical protein
MAGKLKKVSYEFIDRQSEIGIPMYELLDDLLVKHHKELIDARIALAWCTSWNADVDGRITLGKCKKASDLDRELASFDFVIMLSRDFWHSVRVTALQRMALLDHELMHATVALDAKGEPKLDERRRVVYRIRKHDIEEFGAIVARYGLYKRDLTWFVAQVPTLRKESDVRGERDAVVVETSHVIQ